MKDPQTVIDFHFLVCGDDCGRRHRITIPRLILSGSNLSYCLAKDQAVTMAALRCSIGAPVFIDAEEHPMTSDKLDTIEKDNRRNLIVQVLLAIACFPLSIFLRIKS